MNLYVTISLAPTLAGPRGNGPTSRGNGSVSGSASLWNGIGGFRGRPHPPWQRYRAVIPYCSMLVRAVRKLTWQIASGLGHHTSWSDLLLTGAIFPSSRTAALYGNFGQWPDEREWIDNALRPGGRSPRYQYGYVSISPRRCCLRSAFLCLSATASVAQDDLITASGAGDLSTVKALIAANADVDPERGDGITR